MGYRCTDIKLILFTATFDINIKFVFIYKLENKTLNNPFKNKLGYLLGTYQ